MLFSSSDTIYPVIPLRDLVVFPHSITPLFVGRPQSVKAVEYALRRGKQVLLVAQKDANVDDPRGGDLYTLGVIATIIQHVKLPDGTIKILVDALQRAKILEFREESPFLEARVLPIEDSYLLTPETEALTRAIMEAFEKYASFNTKIPSEVVISLKGMEDPGRFADTIASHISLKTKEKQEILATLDLKDRMEKIYAYLQLETEVLEVENRIKNRVKKQMEKNQREYYLNEQLKAIQKELGRSDLNEIEELKEKIKKARMPKHVAKKAEDELRKLELMPAMSAEATVVRNYLDWLIALPWSKRTRDKLDIKKAAQILDEDHYGLEEVKERILEYLAVRRLVKKNKGPILCFVGPPGVGKTSLGKSIARAMGRRFVRVSLGGVRDEAEIRGHRRTYVGALPGRIIQMMKKAGTKNPVMLLDEVDKLSSDFRGDPASALLEVLDPEQNSNFSDHYLGVEFDLSEVFFITTANVLYSIPRPLQDRMEVIRLPGYTEYEKKMIARHFLLPRQVKGHGIPEERLIVEDSAILGIIREYTREAGVRNLERELAKICRKVARRLVEGQGDFPIKVRGEDLEEYLGVPKYRHGKAEASPEVGVVQGLAWTENGGELLTTEAAVVEGKGDLILTGKLGEVMQESAKAALTFVRSRAKALGISTDYFQKVDIHIHLPEGAIPKDGPSAGITIATALASAIAHIPVYADVAMTGEVTLRGKVLPIGGLKEKLLAAKRGKLKRVIIPEENKKDLKEVPEEIRKGLEIVLVEHMDQVLDMALVGWKREDKTAIAPPQIISSTEIRPTFTS